MTVNYHGTTPANFQELIGLALARKVGGNSVLSGRRRRERGIDQMAQRKLKKLGHGTSRARPRYTFVREGANNG